MTTLTAEETIQLAYQHIKETNTHDVVSVGWVSDGVVVVVMKGESTYACWLVLDEGGTGWSGLSINHKKAAPTFDKTQGLRARLLKEYA